MVRNSQSHKEILPVTVSIDVSEIPEGTELTLSFDLLGFGEADSFVEIADVGFILEEPTSPEVVDANVFYNDSSFDENDASVGEADDNAIATDKEVLRPGETASFENYTSYWRGINGLMIDIPNLPGSPKTDDFAFRIGNDNEPENWAAAPAPENISVRKGAGKDGSDRVTLVWPHRAIMNQWLEVTVRATDNTGLAADDVFYIGNAIGDTGNSERNTFVDGTDITRAIDNIHGTVNPAAIDNPLDFNRDRFVDGADFTIVRDHATNFLTDLNLISPPVKGDPTNVAGNDGLVAAFPAFGPLHEKPQVSDSLDVNRDGHISPSDLLTVIHAINCLSKYHEQDHDTVAGCVPDSMSSADPYHSVDVSRDGFVTPRDALMLLHALNQPRVDQPVNKETKNSAEIQITTPDQEQKQAVTRSVDEAFALPHQIELTFDDDETEEPENWFDNDTDDGILDALLSDDF